MLIVVNSEQDMLHSDINHQCFMHCNIVDRWIYMSATYSTRSATNLSNINRDIAISCSSLSSTASRDVLKWQVRSALFPYQECTKCAHFQKRKYINLILLCTSVWWVSIQRYLFVFGKHPVSPFPEKEICNFDIIMQLCLATIHTQIFGCAWETSWVPISKKGNM